MSKEIIQKELERFDKKYWKYLEQHYPNKEHGLFESIKNFLIQSNINILKAEVEKIEGMKRETEHIKDATIKCQEDFNEAVFNARDIGYNQALEDIINNKKKLIKELE